MVANAATSEPIMKLVPIAFEKTPAAVDPVFKKNESGILDNLPTPDTPSTQQPAPATTTATAQPAAAAVAPASVSPTATRPEKSVAVAERPESGILDAMPSTPSNTADKYMTLKKKTMTLKKTGVEMMDSPVSGSGSRLSFYDSGTIPDDTKADVLAAKKAAAAGSDAALTQLAKQQEQSLAFVTQPVASSKLATAVAAGEISDAQVKQLKKELTDIIKQEFAAAKAEIIQGTRFFSHLILNFLLIIFFIAVRTDLMKLIEAITSE